MSPIPLHPPRVTISWGLVRVCPHPRFAVLPPHVGEDCPLIICRPLRHRSNYSVAATVVVLMVVLAFTASFVRPHIPGPPPNAIATYPGDYMKQGAGEMIDWHPIDANAFAEARRLDRPVLLFVGVAWSQFAREFDQEVLSSPDIQNYLSHNFVCVRIDGDEMPVWISSYLPVTRVSLGIRARFQIWVLEPDGRLVSNIGRRRPATHLDQSQFLDELVRVRQIYTQVREQNLTSDVDAQEAADIAQIEAMGNSPFVDFNAVNRTIAAAADETNGGFPQNGFQDLHPYAWEFLAQAGDVDVLHASLTPVLHSPITDLMDGGFFVTSGGLDWKSVEFDKSAVGNAEMAWMLSQVRTEMGASEGVCDYLLRGTVASLTGEFVDANGFVRAGRIGDVAEDGRSARTSVPPRRMREVLNSEQREWARINLGLRVETNPVMAPYLSSNQDPNDADSMLAALRNRTAPSHFTNGEFMDVNGTVAARLMETGRAVGDQHIIDFGSSLFAKLDSFRVFDQVPHDLDVAARAPATLGDYLAYSDAALQDYLTSGRVVSLQNGLTVLQRALVTYAGPNPGEFRLGLPPSSDLIPSESVTAQVVDDLGESASAKVIRLCTAYGRLLLGDNSESNQGLTLLRTALATAQLINQPAGDLGVSAAGFACDSAILADDEYAITVGPQAQQMADQLYRHNPLRFVAAAFGPVRPDLRDKKPGVYLVLQGRPVGPMAVDEAEAQLPAFLQLKGNG